MRQLLLATTALVLLSSIAQASPIVAGFNANSLAGNDDGSTGPVSIGFNANFFGTTYNQLYVNNNGNVTFNAALSTFTPFGLTSAIGTPIIAPFFADVDTRTGNLTTYGTGSVAGHAAFGVNWPDVGYFAERTDKLNNFQLLLIDRSDTGAGNFDIEFNYGRIQWETGEASGGVNGLGGSSARAGYSNGTGAAGSFFEIAGSGINGAFLDGGPNALITATNDGVPGQFLFSVRNGAVINPETPPSSVPEPATLALFGLSLAGLGAMRRARRD